ncbi:MAG TPA: geranylgeranyl reductase family protein [Anaerolineae bacterium]
MDEHYDVVIVGAGPGGSAAAWYLARHGLQVLLLDKADFPRDKTCGDGLSPRALAVLDDMGLLENLLHVGCRINGVEIYAPDGRSIAAPVPSGNGRPPYMLVLPRLTLDDTLRRYAVAQGALFVSGAHVTDVQTEGNVARVQVENAGRAQVYTCCIAVIATGASVRLLQNAGILTETPAMMMAARAYYDGIDVMSDRIQLRFDGVRLPGYAWVFPGGRRTANVGAGYFAKDKRQRDRWTSPQDAVRTFVEKSQLKDVLGQAERVSSVKGYPLRVDFTTAPTFNGRVLLVGEAAGLVNPLSGEGVDYALESARVAAEHIVEMFERSDFSQSAFEAYDRELRERFQALFKFCSRARDLFINRTALNLLVAIAAHRKDLKLLLIRIVLGDQTVPQRITAGMVVRTLFTRASG